ncbi:MAG: diguanylate cyclase [Treponema sp.]|jgi:diguanylate cyclase (GGDEF)-like protein|nr:diguanylate cyclase [Treponema sp.]
MNDGPKHTILTIDDEDANLMVLNHILFEKYDIYMAKTGQVALKLAREKKPDLILLDIILPDITGFEVLEKLQSDPETNKIPVICITGLDSENDEEKGFLLGAVDYIKKPFKNTIVKIRVNTHIKILQQMRIIERYGLTDPLTDIANRRNFDERIDMEWRRAIREKKPVSFLMIDIDKFKHYNDTYGHPQGDTLLKTVAKIFVAIARRPADLPARLGGEEFGILLPSTGAEAAFLVAESIRAAVESLRVPTADRSEMTTVTVSIGVATALPAKNDLVKDFISRADKNLYIAKKTGKNRVCVDVADA